MAGQTTDASRVTREPLPVSIVIPAYGAAPQLAECLESLRKHAPPGCEVVVADDATPDESVAEVAKSYLAHLSLNYVRRAQNLGFVENCNEAIRSILPSGNDVLLLNSDTKVTARFLEEMWEVLHIHEKHGAVSPRSNNATIFSVPVSERLKPEDAYELWMSIRGLLPRYQVMPTAVGFCLLLKNSVLRQLGLFDPIYSPGYNEENDLICRMNRHGYSAVAAHQAFVFHLESASFGPRQKMLDRRNRQVLYERYPEYPRKLAEHFQYGLDPIDHFAPLWRTHRRNILIDLFHLPARHSGTSDFALSLLLHLAPLLEAKYDVSLGLSEAAKQFFSHELTGYRFYDSARHANMRFDLLFKPSQIFTWPELYRMVRLGGRIAYTHLDIIAVRCDYLSGPNTRALFKTAAQLADRVITISEFSKQDFAAFYGTPFPFEVIHLGTHHDPPVNSNAGGHVLVVGNRFHHKAVQRAVAELQGVGHVVALGVEEASGSETRWLASGALSRSAVAELYDHAAVVVYPSFYEGFGMPIVDAIARGLRVVALDSAVNQEIRALTDSDYLVLVKDHTEMRSAVSNILSDPLVGSPKEESLRKWPDVARQYAQSFDDLLDRNLDTELIRRRWDLLATIDAVHPLG